MSTQPPPFYSKEEEHRQQSAPSYTMSSHQQQPIGQPVPQPAVYMQPYQPAMMPYPTYAVPPPRPPSEFIPNDYLIITLVIMIPCAIINITTLFFTIPALVCSVLSFEKKTHGMQFYKSAKNLGMSALILDIVALCWFFGWGIFCTAISIWSVYHRLYYYYGK